LKKRKKKHRKTTVHFQTEPDILNDIQFMKPDDEINFECSCCGECCRNVELSVMLEPYDLYRTARYLRGTDASINGIEDVITKYAEIKMLGNTNFPIFMLKTRGQKKECVFLKGGRCSIHEAKPRACQLYPIGAWPNDALDGFDYFIASRKQHHFKGASMRITDWMDANFDSQCREITLCDARSTTELVPILRTLQLAGVERDHILEPLLMFKYICFDLNEPFLPQFNRNMCWLNNALLSMVGST